MQFDMCLLSLQPFVFEGQCAAEMCTGWSVTGELRTLDISTRLRADEAGAVSRRLVSRCECRHGAVSVSWTLG